MKGLLTKLTIMGLVSGMLLAQELPDLMKEAATRVQREIHEAEYAAEKNNAESPIRGRIIPFSPRSNAPHTPTPEELAIQAKAYLESDKAELAWTQNLMQRLEKEAKKVHAKLKTKKGRDTLKAMIGAFKVETDDVATFLGLCEKSIPNPYPKNQVASIFHYRLEEAFGAASSVLFKYITAGVLAGSSDELADLETLQKNFRNIAPSFGDFFDDNTFYCSLRDHYAECCAVIPYWDVPARFKIATHVTKMGKFAFNASDDGDTFQTNHALVVVAEDFVRDTQLSFVNKKAPTANSLIFKDQNTELRLQNFLAKAHDIFDAYYNQTNAVIDANLKKQNWDRWVYVGGNYVHSNKLSGSQIILISPDGCTSVRLKQSGKFSIGFLAPYSPKNHASFSDYLYDRTTELLKFSSHQGALLAIPAARPETGLTPYWVVVPSISLVNAVMADAHF